MTRSSALPDVLLFHSYGQLAPESHTVLELSGMVCVFELSTEKVARPWKGTPSP